MTPTLEKVARAINPHPWSSEADDWTPTAILATKTKAIEQARNALKSLLQPDDGTVEAMAADDVPLEPRAVFEAAIRHILGEE